MESWREELYHSGYGVCFVDNHSDTITHFGIKGMKWGQRKVKTSGIKKEIQPSHGALVEVDSDKSLLDFLAGQTFFDKDNPKEGERQETLRKELIGCLEKIIALRQKGPKAEGALRVLDTRKKKLMLELFGHI